MTSHLPISGNRREPAPEAERRNFASDGGLARKIAALMASDAKAGHVVNDAEHWMTLRLDKPNSGHDATPLATSLLGLSTFLTVADGMGGRGASQHLVGFPHAAIASRLVLEKVITLVGQMVNTGTNPRHAEVIGHLLYKTLKDTWEGALREELASVSPFGGSMVSTLPTTFTMVEVNRPPTAAGMSFTVNAFNCGDSRAYVLETAQRGGLAALTTDDTCTAVDAFTALTDDPPLASFLTADKEQIVSFRNHSVSSPCLVFACSDGFHHYFDTPLGLEVLLRIAMNKAVTKANPMAAFALEIETYFSKRLQDDVSAAILVVGGPVESVFRSLTAPKTERERLRQLYDEEKSAKKDRVAAKANWETCRKSDFERFTEVGS